MPSFNDFIKSNNHANYKFKIECLKMKMEKCKAILWV